MKKKLLLFVLILGAFFSFGQNYSINLDGTDDVLTFPACQGLTAPSFTIEGWVKCIPDPYAQVLLMAFRDDVTFLNANITLEVRSNGLLRFNYRAYAATLGGNEVYSTTAIDDAEWHHFAAVKDNNAHLLLYIDGVMEASGDFQLENVTEAPFFELGRNKYDGSGNLRWLHGNLDDVKIWAEAKSASEISTKYLMESSALEVGLFSNYKFDISSDTIFDCSVNLNHGTRSGSNGQNNLPQFDPITPNLVDVACYLAPIETDTMRCDPQSIFLQPNPASNSLKILFNDPIFCDITVINVLGQIVQTIKAKERYAEKTISVKDLPSGNYFIIVVLPKRILAHKLVKI